jgi:hypothetical protein
MKNEIREFFEGNDEEIEYLINEARRILNNDYTNKNENSFILIHLLSSIENEHIKEINIREEHKQLLHSFIKEDEYRIKNYVKGINETPKILDFEWKFIGLSPLNNENAIIPKIVLKLVYSNGSEKLVETNFSTFKKFQEEVEESLSAYNSVYSKRIDSFAK